MTTVNTHEAKTQLSRLLAAVESGEEDEVVIARNGKPIARLVPMLKRRPIILGIAQGQFKVPANIDEDNDEIARLFHGDDD